MNTTLDEWEILHAVVQLGGFAPAAEQLNRSQSTISYAVARLQDKLGIKLFEIKGRRAVLTEAGRTLLADAEPHLSGFHHLEQRARSLSSGGESEIRISVDSIFPNDRLFASLAEFSHRFPYVHSTLRQSTFLSCDSEFSGHNAQLCISGLMSREYFVHPILDIRMVAVARTDHQLNCLKRPVFRADMMHHALAIIEGVAAGVAKRQPRGPAQRYLPVGTIEAAIDAVRSGLCFGWLPQYRIQDMVDSGELSLLCMSAGGTRHVRLNLICRDLDAASKEFLALADLLGLHRGVETI
jgi:DNA-binding transcriptional LysR family regulator